MSFARRSIPSRRLLSSNSLIRKTQPNARTWNLINRRGYASGSEGEHKAGSDLPWLLTSVAVTIPGAAWLWSQGPSSGGHGHGEHDEHGDEHSEGDDHGEVKEEESSDDAADSKDSAKKPDGNDSEESEGKPEKDEKSSKEKMEDSEDKSESDSDSGNDSKDTPNTSDDEKADSKAAPKSGATNAQHKGKTHDDKSLSKKGEGIHDTAKLTGTVDPFRKAK